MKSTGRYTRLGTVSVLAMVMAAGMGCSMQSEPGVDSKSIASADQFISVALKTAPAFVASTGAVTVAMVDETAEIYVNAADSSLMVNGVQAVDSTTTPPTVAIAAGKSANIKTIAVSDSTAMTGDVVILNYINGVFGLGGASAGTTVSLKAGKTNTLVVKGTALADNFAIGPSGITLTNGAKTPTLDVVPTNVGAFSFFLGAGDDVFTSNATITGGVFGNAVSIYGGAGNDTLNESAVSTPKETFSGGPGTDTVDYSKRPATTALTGTLAITNASAAVVGTGTAFTTELSVGQIVTFAGQAGVNYKVSVITDATHITLSANYSGTTAAASAATRFNAVSTVIDPLAGATSTSGWAPKTAADPTAGAFEADVLLDVDVIKGGAGDDQLMGALVAGTSVTLNGGLGNDTFCEGAAANSADTLVGGGGVDVVDYSNRSASLTVVMDGKTKSGDPAGSGEGDVIGTDIANVKLGSGGGTYTGNALNNKFFAGTGGTSVVNGLDGDDTLDEGTNASNAGNETFHGGKGTDAVDYSARTHALSVTMDGVTKGGDGAEQDVVDVDVENLYGGTNGDTLVGNALDNDIEGNGASAGVDVISGMAGNDTLVGAGPTSVALGTTVKANLHGNDAADTAEPGAFNMCLSTGASGTPSAAGAQNCELVTQ